MAATLASQFPEKAAELLAYQALIIRDKRNYEPGRWVMYYRQIRREALARGDLNWSFTDICLYSEAFTGRARAILQCPYCLQDDHTARYCPRNPDRPWLSWARVINVQSPCPFQTQAPHKMHAPSAHQRSLAELCK